MALPPEDYARGEAHLNGRGKINGREWREIQTRMQILSRKVDRA